MLEEDHDIVVKRASRPMERRDQIRLRKDNVYLLHLPCYPEEGWLSVDLLKSTAFRTSLVGCIRGKGRGASPAGPAVAMAMVVV